MDLVIKFLNEDSGLVEFWYFDSSFLKQPNAGYLHDELLLSLFSLYLEKLIQISMDDLSTLCT